jgi:hypothetical protein
LITGRLDSLSRGNAEERLRALGAKIAPGMNKAVSHLIVGEDRVPSWQAPRNSGRQYTMKPGWCVYSTSR